MIVNPIEISNTSNKEIDYEKLLNKFGCYPITEDIITKIEKLTGKPVHHLIKRGIFYAHRDFDMILNAFEKH